MPQGQPERPAWQVRISPAVAGAAGAPVEAGVPSGAGVWVGGRWVLTCAHVIGAEPRTVMARFSFADWEPIAARVASDGWRPGEQGDLALLELDRDLPPSAQPPPLRLARSVTGHSCAIYGYPAGHEGGVWTGSKVTGPTVNRLQLTALEGYGHQIEKGFSGAGLFDTEMAAVVGLIVTRDRGKDVLGGFAIPMQDVVAAFPQLAPWVGWRLGTDRFLRQHWRPRARGVYQDTTPGWYFTGRTALLRELTGWLEDQSPGRAVRVVTGPAGTGKSAVLAWLCAVSDPQLRTEIASARPAALAETAAVPAAGRVSAAVWARDMDALSAARALAATLTLPVVASAAVEDVRAAVGDLDPTDRARLVVVVDALDEARKPRQIVRELLLPLAHDLGVKVLAGTRPGRDGELLAAFAKRTVVYRLDDPAWFDRQDLADYAATCLRADFDPDLYSGYRTDPNACRQVADAIADAAGSNFLVAGLAARARASEPVIDIGAPGWRHRQRFPADVGQAFDDYLDRFGDNKTRVQDLLRAVAYAEEPGLAAGELWADMASALAAPRRYHSGDLAWLLDNAAAYLIESSEHSEVTYRIFHQALIDYLRPAQQETRAQGKLTSVLTQAVPSGPAGPDWAHAPSYIRTHLAAHAAAAGQIDELLEDPVYLAEADPAGLLDVLPAAATSRAREAERLLRRVGSRLRQRAVGERAAVLELGARQLGAGWIADRLARLRLQRPWSVVWAHENPAGHDQILGWHDGNVQAVAVRELHQKAVVVSGGLDGMVRVWDMRTGSPLGEWRHGPGPVEAIAIGELANGPVVVSGGKDGMLRSWELADGSPRGEPLRFRYGGEITSAAVGDLDGRPFIVAAHKDGGTIELWDLDTGQHLGMLEWESNSTFTPWRRDVTLHTVVAGFANGQPVIVAGHSDGAHLWAWTGEMWAARPLIEGSGTIWSVALASLGGRPIAVCGGGMLRTVDLETGEPATSPYRSPDGEIIGVAVGDVEGHAMAVTGNFFGIDPGILRVWDLTDEQEPLRGSLTGHYGGVQALAITHLGDRAILVSGGFDHAVCAWDLAARLDRTPDRIEYQHISWLQAGEIGGGGPVVASRSSVSVNFSKDRAWQKKKTSLPDLSASIKDVLREDKETSPQSVIRIWDQTDGTVIGAQPLDHNSSSEFCAAGRAGDALIVASVFTPAQPGRSGAEQSTYLAVTNLRTGVLMGRPIPIREGARGSIAMGAAAGRPVVAFCEDFAGNDDYPRHDERSKDNRLQVWDIQSGKLAWEPLPAYCEDGGGPVVRAVGTAAGQPIAVITTPGRFGIWDLGSGELLAEPPSMQGEGWVHPPAAIGELAGRPVAVYSGYGRPIRIWDYTADHECQRAIEVDAEISAITIAPDSTIIAGGPAGMLAIRVGATFFDPLPGPRERRTKAKDAQAKVFSVAGPADRDYLASISHRRPSESDLDHYAQLREKLGEIDEEEPRCGYDGFGRLVLSGTSLNYYDLTMGTVFAVRWPFLRMEYRPLWSGSEDIDDSAVFRGDASYGDRPVYIFHPDGRIDLLPGEDLDWDFGWGDEEISSYNLGASVCRAAGLLRGSRRETPRAFRYWLKDLIQDQHHTDQPLMIPVSLVRKNFKRLAKAPEH